MATKQGKQTVVFPGQPVIAGQGTVAGPHEGKGPAGTYFDKIHPDLQLKKKSFEQAELAMMEEAIDLALEKAVLAKDEVDVFVGGDLLNQIITTSFAARSLAVPYLGLYGACSSFAQSLTLAALLIDCGAAQNVLAATSSHNCTAERQYRYPTEYGAQLPPWSQHTVTGAGACVVRVSGAGPAIEMATIGKVVDLGITDPFNMGAAMAPAAVDTILTHLDDTGRTPEYYDLIVTGDLGRFGWELALDLAQCQGTDLNNNCRDCGTLIYSKDQEMNSGGSGCACSALVTLGMLFSQNYTNILVVATGALHSPTTYQQGESIPAIAHAVALKFPQTGGA